MEKDNKISVNYTDKLVIDAMLTIDCKKYENYKNIEISQNDLQIACDKAVMFGNLEMLKYLLSINGNIDLEKLVNISVSSGRTNILKYLLKNKINIRGRGDKALICAIFPHNKNDLKPVKILLKYGVNTKRLGNQIALAERRHDENDIIKYLKSIGYKATEKKNIFD